MKPLVLNIVLSRRCKRRILPPLTEMRTILLWCSRRWVSVSCGNTTASYGVRPCLLALTWSAAVPFRLLIRLALLRHRCLGIVKLLPQANALFAPHGGLTQTSPMVCEQLPPRSPSIRRPLFLTRML